MTPSTRTSDLSLVLELAGASVAMPPEEFADYASGRVKPMLVDRDPQYLTDVITLSATMTGAVIQNWAEDTGREPQEILNLIRGQWAQEAGM